MGILNETARAWADELTKIAFETQDYHLRGGRLVSVYGGNRPRTMTMAKARGLTPKAHPHMQGYWEAEEEVKDPASRVRAKAQVQKRAVRTRERNKGWFGAPLPLIGGKKRERYLAAEKKLEQLRKLARSGG